MIKFFKKEKIFAAFFICAVLLLTFLRSISAAEPTNPNQPIIPNVPLESISKIKPISATSAPVLIGDIIKAVLGVTGAVALLMFVYGGIMWMTSGGSAERIKKAQSTMVWAVLGLAVIFISYTVIDQIMSAFGY